ncbi:small multi-drug export protein [Paenibacillus sp. N3.4]|uniref:small multi-drug export protein n=1 Tax=Paenibacillus sp. N3.4 TaxID=2603222 RepID=UPI0011C90B0F|nr:small multi-drug export protein [Paenibacillus sp. N3.4]TXK71675.1 small multi-drug export protein [Paenibacillus sp. N3.4]TXK71689.1 small multi-drug export protein [Paenibacillus sp. N3.4]
MDSLLTWASVVGTGILELWAAIPLGFTLKLHPLLTGILSAVGSMLSAVIVIFFGTSIRNWLVRRTQNKSGGGRSSRMIRIWDKYGIPGIGFLSPLITGAPLGAAIGISFGAEPRKLFVWMTIGIVFWSAFLTTAVALGLNVFT